MAPKVAWPKVIWSDEDQAVPYMVDLVLADIGMENATVRTAARKFALHLLEEITGLGGSLEMGEWQHSMGLFGQGYETALRDNHLL